jgi:nucleotide-binding universal stress UspA family protein
VKRVLVALDASSYAPQVLNAALSLAESTQAEVHAYCSSPELAALTTGAIRLVPPAPGERAWWEQVLDAARRIAADTVVIGSGTSGHDVDEDAARVLEQARCAVLVVYKRGSRLSLK